MRLDGEYGLNDTVVSVPVKLGWDGVEQVIELELTEEENAALAESAQAVQDLIRVMNLG